MQLMRRCWHHKAVSVALLLIALVSIVWSGAVLAAVLPEDRADVLYHRYEGGGMEIRGPSVLVRKAVSNSVSVSANHYVDKVSAASVDVVTTASPYEEERKENSVGLDYLVGKAIYSLAYTKSKENDFTAKAFNFGASQDFFGDLTTLSFGYAVGEDVVGRTGDPFFQENADRQHFRFGITQVITKNMLVSLSHEFITDEGYLNNPYRQVRYINAGGTGTLNQAEVYPNTRASEATALRLGYYLPWRAGLHIEYRVFEDSWGIDSKDWGLTYVHPLQDGWEIEASFRQYRQSAADFYSDLFPYKDAQNFLARDKELSTFDSQSFGLAASWTFLKGRYRLLDRFAVRLAVDRYRFDYKDFRDLRVPVSVVGTEPLYSFNATVTQMLFSVWY